MNRLDYKINDSLCRINQTKEDIKCYAENIQMIIDNWNNPESIKKLEEDRDIDKWFLWLLETFHDELLKKLKPHNSIS